MALIELVIGFDGMDDRCSQAGPCNHTTNEPGAGGRLRV